MNPESLRSELLRLGWTVENVRERLATCRANARVFRTCPAHSRFTYRLLNVCQYLQNRARLAALS